MSEQPDQAENIKHLLQSVTAEPDELLLEKISATIRFGDAPSAQAAAAARTVIDAEPVRVKFNAPERLRRRRTLVFAGSLASILVGLLGIRFALGLADTKVVVADQPTSSPLPPRADELERVFDLDLTDRSVANNQTDRVIPAVGPALSIVRRGTGTNSNNTEFGGQTFGRGGQQRDNTSFLTATGKDVADLVSLRNGALRVEVTPLKSVSELRVDSGRNFRTYVHVVSDENGTQNGQEKINELLVVSMGVDPDGNVLLMASVNNSNGIITLDAAQQKLFDAGKKLTIDLRWSNGKSTILLNGKTVGTADYSLAHPLATSTARLTVGAAADYEGGYFSSADHVVQRIVLQRATENGTAVR